MLGVGKDEQGANRKRLNKEGSARESLSNSWPRYASTVVSQ